MGTCFYSEQVVYADEGDKSGPVILCIHGAPATHKSYRHLVHGLTSHGYRVILPNLPGMTLLLTTPKAWFILPVNANVIQILTDTHDCFPNKCFTRVEQKSTVANYSLRICDVKIRISLPFAGSMNQA